MPVGGASAEIVPAQSQRLVITLTPTSDEGSDIVRLRQLISAIKEFPGQDEVTLWVNGTELKLASTGYCPELQQRLAELVGEEGVRVETLIM